MAKYFDEHDASDLVQLAYNHADQKILQAAIDVAEGKPGGLNFFNRFSTIELVNRCHEDLIKEFYGN